MILGIGIDSVEVNRFADWHTKTAEQLHNIFSTDEIAYCLSGNTQTSAERFAARFAAREAFFKALHAMCATLKIKHNTNLFSTNKLVYVERTEHGMPVLHVDWLSLLPNVTTLPKVHISLTHTKDLASAFVIIEK